MTAATTSTTAGGPAMKEIDSQMKPSGQTFLADLRGTAAVALLLGTLALLAFAQVAVAGYGNVGTFSGAGTEDGQLTAPKRAVVESSTGNLLVADGGNDRIQVFEPDGSSATYLTQFGAGALDSPAGIALDQGSGDVYVADAGNDRIVKFTSDGAATPTYTLDASFTSPAKGSAAGEIGAFDVALAVDQASGDLLVADRANNRISRYAADGTFDSSFDGSDSPGGAFTGLLDLATDSAGDVIVVDSTTGSLIDLANGTSSSRVERFDATGAHQASVGPVQAPGVVAVDPDNDEVIVGTNFDVNASFQSLTLERFSADGTAVDETALHGSTFFGVIAGLAVQGGGSELLYVISDIDAAGAGWGTVGGFVYEDLPAPSATIAPTTDVTDRTATFHGSVNPNGVETVYHFELSRDGGPFNQHINDLPAGDGTTDVAVTDSLDDLEPNMEHRVRLVARSIAGRTVSTEDVFTTEAVPPLVHSGFAPSNVTTTGARLNGRVNPRNSATTYYFEYGPDTSYGSSAPVSQDASAGDENVSVPVFQDVAGLQPGTVYHYRLVAVSAAGTTTGPDRTLTTRAADPEQPGVKDPVIPGRGFLPDNRGWEKVSPDDKNDSDLLLGSHTQAAIGGGAVVFASDGAFGDSKGSSLGNQFLARRGASGWSIQPLLPGAGPDLANPNPDHYRGYRAFSDDVTKGVLRSGIEDPLLAPGASDQVRNLYWSDLDADQHQLVTPTPDPMPDAFTALFDAPIVGDTTPDMSHVFFESKLALTPDAPAGTTNAYEWVNGQTRLASVLPDGTPAADGGVVGIGLGSSTTGFHTPRTISDDGTRLFFSAPYPNFSHPLDATPPGGPVQVYVREDGATTTKVSASQRTTPDPAGPLPASYETASTDGSRVFFISCEKLTDDSTAHPSPNSPGATTCGGGSSDLYMYDVDSGELTDLTVTDPKGSLVVDVLDADAAGSYVYFVAQGQLDGDEGVRGEDNLYVWHDGEVRFISGLASTSDELQDAFIRPQRTYQRPHSKASADGRYLIYETVRPQTAYDNAGFRLLYRYDFAEDSVECISCDPSGQPATAHTRMDSLGSGIFMPLAQYQPRNQTADGELVFFETADSLVSRDTNGKIDVYQYEDGDLRLLSDGSGPYDSQFLDASADGDEVFFMSRNRLVAADRDNIRDVYVAKVGGGFPEPQQAQPPCEGDACQPAGAPLPSRSNPASATLDGAGDVSAGERATLATLRVSAAQRARLARGGRIVLRVRVNRAGRVSVVARARLGGRRAVVARGSRRARRAGTVGVALRLSARARRHVADGRRLRTVLDVRFAGRADQLTLNLERPVSR